MRTDQNWLLAVQFQLAEFWVVGTGSGSGSSKKGKKTRPDQTLKYYLEPYL